LFTDNIKIHFIWYVIRGDNCAFYYDWLKL